MEEWIGRSGGGKEWRSGGEEWRSGGGEWRKGSEGGGEEGGSGGGSGGVKEDREEWSSGVD